MENSHLEGTSDKEQATDQLLPILGDLQALFGNPPLLKSENRQNYWNLLGRIAECVEPTDTLERFWLKDFADNTWEIQRLRQLNAAWLDQAIAQGMMASPRGYILYMAGYETVAKLIAAAEFRRDRILREIELRRDGLARRLRKVSDEITHADKEGPLPADSSGASS